MSENVSKHHSLLLRAWMNHHLCSVPSGNFQQEYNVKSPNEEFSFIFEHGIKDEFSILDGDIVKFIASIEINKSSQRPSELELKSFIKKIQLLYMRQIFFIENEGKICEQKYVDFSKSLIDLYNNANKSYFNSEIMKILKMKVPACNVKPYDFYNNITFREINENEKYIIPDTIVVFCPDFNDNGIFILPFKYGWYMILHDGENTEKIDDINIIETLTKDRQCYQNKNNYKKAV